MVSEHNSLSGRNPAGVRAVLPSLGSLWLSANQLSGPIPPELGGLARLTWLRLSHNQLSGPIPPSLGSLANLNKLQLEGNQLSGEIPRELGSLSSRSCSLLAGTN